jgi:gamma-glutamylcyclotransferase (GGCT)/AIG2-like uncharacterized protein YtfP
MSLISNIFVYGTLREGRLEHVLPEIKRFVTYSEKGYVKGRLFDVGDFPGARPARLDNKKVYGQLIEIKPEHESDVFKELDEYEEYNPSNPDSSLFVRKKVNVVTKEGKNINAWIYWYNHKVNNLKEITDGIYRKRKKNL